MLIFFFLLNADALRWRSPLMMCNLENTIFGAILQAAHPQLAEKTAGKEDREVRKK